MFSEFKSLAKTLSYQFSNGSSFIFYGLAFFCSGITPFILLPILTSELSVKEFGELSLFLILVPILSSIVRFSSDGYISISYFKNSKKEFPKIFNNSYFFLTSMHSVILLCLLIFNIFIESEYDRIIFLSFFGVTASLFLCLNFNFLAFFQSSNNPKIYFIIRFILMVIDVFICLLGIYFLKIDIFARLISYTLSFIIAVLIGSFFYKKISNNTLQLKYNKRIMNRFLLFGLKLSPHVSIGMLSVYIDRIFISSMLGVEKFGIYSLAAQIGMLMVAINEPINKAFSPWFYKKISSESYNDKLLIIRFTYLIYLVLIIFGVLMLFISLAFFDMFIDEKFASSKKLIPFFILGYIFNGMYYTVINYLIFFEKTGKLSLITFCTTCTGLLITLLLITKYKMMGGAYAFTINSAILFSVILYFSSKEVKMPWFLR